MFKTLQNALKVKEIRKRLLYTFLVLVVVRLGCQIPTPGINTEYVAQFFSSQFGANGSTAMNFFDAMTGGSFSTMSIFALSITPYITASIIIQLLTIAIPALEEMQKDGEDGRKKITAITRYMNIALSVIESMSMAIGFGANNFLEEELGFLNVTVIVVCMTAGSAFLMWLGEQITDKGVGNGISIILLVNILSRLPQDLLSLYNQFIKGKELAYAGLAAVIILAIIIAMVIFVVILGDAERHIPVQYAKKVQGRKLIGGQSSQIPLKVNTAGVIPIIFAGSILSFPIIIAKFMSIEPASGAGATLFQKFLKVCNQNSWCNFTSFAEFKYTLGLVVYIAMVIFFAYFYTSITFNPLEVANNMKKQGGFIPGIRPGKPTVDYLTKVLNYIIFIGACGLTIAGVVPIFFSGAFGANVSFGGTSLIIIVGVVLETMKQIESMMLVRHYKGFLND